MIRTYPYAVWTTNHGGVVRFLGDRHVFVEAAPNYKVGDLMPRGSTLVLLTNDTTKVEHCETCGHERWAIPINSRCVTCQRRDVEAMADPETYLAEACVVLGLEHMWPLSKGNKAVDNHQS